MGDRIQVPLKLADFDVVDTGLVDGVLEVTVNSTFPRACFHCGSTDVVGHGRCRRRLRDRGHGYPTVLIWNQRRFRCRDCGRTSRERHPELLGSKRVTARFRESLGVSACSEPWSDVANRETVSWWRVADAFDARAQLHDPFSGPAPRVLSIDESAFRKRHRYHTVISAPEQKRIVDLEEGRTRQTATNLLDGLPDQWKQSIETVVVDMFWPYRQAVEDVLPHARIVADKFHVIRAVDAAAQKVRIRHGRRITVVGRDGGLARQHNPRFDPKMWRSRWLFMRRRHKLSPAEQSGLNQLFALHPEVGVAWWLKEAFAHIYQAPTRTEAETRFDLWDHHVTEAGLPELTNMRRNLKRWRQPILNYHDDPQTNAYAEGITNKIKVMKRRGYGHRHPNRYRAKVLLTTSHQPTNPPPIA
jgi:transposase